MIGSNSASMIALTICSDSSTQLLNIMLLLDIPSVSPSLHSKSWDCFQPMWHDPPYCILYPESSVVELKLGLYLVYFTKVKGLGDKKGGGLEGRALESWCMRVQECFIDIYHREMRNYTPV